MKADKQKSQYIQCIGQIKFGLLPSCLWNLQICFPSILNPWRRHCPCRWERWQLRAGEVCFLGSVKASSPFLGQH